MAGISYPVQLASIQAYVRQVNGGPRQLSRSEADVMEEYVVQIVSDIEDAWPVDTSTSRDAWTYVIRSGPDWIGFVIENDVDYASYVHYAGTPAEPALWETLLPAAVQAYAGPMLAALRAEILVTQRALAATRAAGGTFRDIVQRAGAWIRRVAS